MYLHELHVQHLKRLGDFRLSFTRKDGQPRMWTVIIGRNGTGKTSILQAIALAAAGKAQVNSLAKPVVGHLRDRRGQEDLRLVATFGFAELARRYPEAELPGPGTTLRSEVILRADEINLDASSCYQSAEAQSGDPLDRARARQLPFWFVAGYGVARALPGVGQRVELVQPAIERLGPLFDPRVALTSLGFVSYFAETEQVKEDDERSKALLFSRTLKSALLTVQELLPGIDDIELRGKGGVKKPGDLLERNRFAQSVGGRSLKLPAAALSHGYQSTIAWIADLVGQILLEARTPVEPREMEGLVLIDEIDLYLHPTWQVVLIRALRRTFPRIQFVATTHSPLLLADLSPDEIVELGFDETTGNVVRQETYADPRVLTGTELLRQFFDIDAIYPSPDPDAVLLRDYLFLARNPMRTEQDEQRLEAMRFQLELAGVDPQCEPVARIGE